MFFFFFLSATLALQYNLCTVHRSVRVLIRCVHTETGILEDLFVEGEVYFILRMNIISHK